MARVSVHAGGGKLSARMHINLPLAKAYTTELNRLAKQLKLAGQVTLDQLIRAPGVFQTDEELVEAEKIWPVLEKALKQALAALVKMREREGAHLAQDLASAHRRHAQGRRNHSETGAADGGKLPPATASNASRAPGWNRPRRMTSGC